MSERARIGSGAIASLTAGDKHDELVALIALTDAQVMPAYRVGAIAERVGSAVRIVQMSEQDRMFTIPDPSHDLIGVASDEAIHAVQQRMNRWGDSIIAWSIFDDGYPANLHSIFNKPPYLFVQGSTDVVQASESVAIVGTRKASEDGLRRARRTARELVEQGFVIVSGLAAGIDGAAHQAALDASGKTLAVMGTGHGKIYPSQHAKLAQDILANGGALVSQFLPGEGARKWTFPQRNITMSGIARATVVVEASDTSGAKMQAREAMRHGRPVFLLPSLVDAQEWAHEYTEIGKYDTKAAMFDTVDELVGQLRSTALPPSLAS